MIATEITGSRQLETNFVCLLCSLHLFVVSDLLLRGVPAVTGTEAVRCKEMNLLRTDGLSEFLIYVRGFPQFDFIVVMSVIILSVAMTEAVAYGQ